MADHTFRSNLQYANILLTLLDMSSKLAGIPQHELISRVRGAGKAFIGGNVPLLTCLHGGANSLAVLALISCEQSLQCYAGADVLQNCTEYLVSADLFSKTPPASAHCLCKIKDSSRRVPDQAGFAQNTAFALKKPGTVDRPGVF